MTALLENIILRIRICTKSEKFKKKHRLPNVKYENDRKIRVSTAFFHVLCQVKTPSGFALGPLIKENSEERFGSLTMLRARSKLSCNAFQELLASIAKELAPQRFWMGYQVLALDGSEINLTHLLSVNKRFYILAMYDLCNQFFVGASFLPSIHDRYVETISLMEASDMPRPQLYLFDKGFHSILLIRRLMESNKKFIIRTSRSFLKEVNEFRSSQKTDSSIFIHYSKRRAHDAKLKHDMPLPYDFTLRCVRLFPSRKEPEILITNLSPEAVTRDDIKALFLLRWGKSNKSPHLNAQLDAEIFNGISENNIKQDFYASLLLYNLSLV